MSSTGIPSVIATIYSSSASIASKIASAANGGELKRIAGFTPWHKGLAISSDGKCILIGSNIQAVIWDVDHEAAVRTLDHDSGVGAVAISGDGRFAVTSAMSSATLWDVGSGGALATFEQDGVTDVALSDDGRYVITESDEFRIAAWDGATGELLCQMRGHTAYAIAADLTPDGRFDGSPGAWQRVTYRKPGTLELLDDDQLRQRHHRPGLLPELLHAKDSNDSPRNSSD